MENTEYTSTPSRGGISLVEMVVAGLIMAALIVGGVVSASRVSPEEIRNLDTFYVYVPVT